jgi:hypothetical protein
MPAEVRKETIYLTNQRETSDIRLHMNVALYKRT